jgi:hypothetical protein
MKDFGLLTVGNTSDLLPIEAAGCEAGALSARAGGEVGR